MSIAPMTRSFSQALSRSISRGLPVTQTEQYMQQQFHNIHEELTMSSRLKKEIIRSTRTKQRQVTIQYQPAPFEQTDISESMLSKSALQTDIMDRIKMLRTMPRVAQKEAKEYKFSVQAQQEGPKFQNYPTNIHVKTKDEEKIELEAKKWAQKPAQQSNNMMSISKTQKLTPKMLKIQSKKHTEDIDTLEVLRKQQFMRTQTVNSRSRSEYEQINNMTEVETQQDNNTYQTFTFSELKKSRGA